MIIESVFYLKIELRPGAKMRRQSKVYTIASTARNKLANTKTWTLVATKRNNLYNTSI